MACVRVEPYGELVGLHIRTEDIDGIVTLTPEMARRIGLDLIAQACDPVASSVLADVERGVG